MYMKQVSGTQWVPSQSLNGASADQRLEHKEYEQSKRTLFHIHPDLWKNLFTFLVVPNIHFKGLQYIFFIYIFCFWPFMAFIDRQAEDMIGKRERETGSDTQQRVSRTRIRCRASAHGARSTNRAKPRPYSTFLTRFR